MGRAVGVELTPTNVRILSLEHAGKRTKLLHFHEAPIPPEPGVPWEDRAAATLKMAFGITKVPRGRVVAALDSGDALLREVSLPFKSEEQVRKTVRFEMESQIHNYTIEQLVVSHYKTGETDKGSLLLAAAVPKTVIDKRLKLFQAAGLDPVALDLDVCAVFNAMHHAGAIDTDEPHLLVYGTPKFTKLVFIEGRQPRSIRTIRFSLAESEPAAGAPEPEPEKPRDPDRPPTELPIVIVDSGTGSFGELEPARQNALIDILSKEISRFLLANAASSSPSHILLAGDFEDPQAASMLQESTQISVRTFNLLDAVDHPFGNVAPSESSRMAASMGLALKGAGLDALGMDFRQDEFQYTRKFEALKTTALVTVELVIVFLAAVALHLYFKRSDLRRANTTVLEHQRTLYENATNETLGDIRMAYPRMKELYTKAMGGGTTDLPIRTSAREAWRDLYGALLKFQQKYGDKNLSGDSLYLELESMDIQQSTTPGNESLTLQIRGKIRNLEYAGALKSELRNYPVFANAEFQGQLPPIEGNLHQFTLKAVKSAKGT